MRGRELQVGGGGGQRLRQDMAQLTTANTASSPCSCTTPQSSVRQLAMPITGLLNRLAQRATMGVLPWMLWLSMRPSPVMTTIRVGHCLWPVSRAGDDDLDAGLELGAEQAYQGGAHATGSTCPGIS